MVWKKDVVVIFVIIDGEERFLSLFSVLFLANAL